MTSVSETAKVKPGEEWSPAVRAFTSTNTELHAWPEKEETAGLGRRFKDDRTGAGADFIQPVLLPFDCLIPDKAPAKIVSLQALLYDKSVTTKAREACAESSFIP